MSPEEQSLWEGVLEEPAEDGPRLVYADWLEEQGDPRGAFIQAQIALEQPGLSDSRRDELRKIEKELHGKYGRRWQPRPAPGGDWGVFRRGWVEELKVRDFDTFMVHADALFRLTPILRLRFHRVELRGRRLEQLLNMPEVSQLQALSMPDARLGDAGVVRLSGCETLAELRELDLERNGIGLAGVRALGGSTTLGMLHFLNLARNNLWHPGAQALAESRLFRQLTVLGVAANELGSVGHVERIGAAWLTHSRGAEGLQVLDMRKNEIRDPDVECFLTSPYLNRLRVLDLSDNPIRPDCVKLLEGRFGPNVVKTGKLIEIPGLHRIARDPNR